MVGKDLGRLAVARIASSRLSAWQWAVAGSRSWRNISIEAGDRFTRFPRHRQMGPVTQQIQYVCADTERNEVHERRAVILSFISAKVLTL
jgi:hypothetical protein